MICRPHFGLRTGSAGRLTLVTLIAAMAITMTVAACGRSQFVSYSPPADLVPLRDGATRSHLGADLLAVGVDVRWCEASELTDFAVEGPEGSDWRAVIQTSDSGERTVWFATQRLRNAQEFDARAEEIRSWFAVPCLNIGGQTDPAVDTITPLTLDGLPAGATSASWESTYTSAVSTVIVDRDRLVMMVVFWEEDPGPIPTEMFVDVVNTAWSQFEADNS